MARWFRLVLMKILVLLLIAVVGVPGSLAQGPAWTQQFPSTIPPIREQHAMAYDVARGQTVLFGGVGGTFSSPILLTDTWVWNGSNWQQQFPATTPPATLTGAARHAMAYDVARQQVVLFLGISCPSSASVQDRTWVWDGTNWAPKSVIGGPAARYGSAMAYDEAHQQAVLFGGFGCSGWLGDTWVWDGTSWTQKTPLASPPPRSYQVMAYDSTRAQVVLSGGINSGVALNDTWIWDGTTWTQRFPASSPSGRYSSTMAEDGARQQLVLFGGADQFGNVPNDTWVWAGTNWTQKTPVTSPSGRLDSATAYDSGRAQIVLFGGNANAFAPVFLNDTWTWMDALRPPWQIRPHGPTFLSPVEGPAEIVNNLNKCSNLKWCLNQHKGPSHKSPGIGGSDDGDAWDANLNTPTFDSDNGNPVWAVAPGTVPATYAGSINAGGSFGQLLIEHTSPNGTWWSGYLHMKNIQVVTGQQVDENTLLGFISNVGVPDGNNHLHFVVYTGQNAPGALRSADATLVKVKSK